MIHVIVQNAEDLKIFLVYRQLRIHKNQTVQHIVCVNPQNVSQIHPIDLNTSGEGFINSLHVMKEEETDGKVWIEVGRNSGILSINNIFM